MARVCCVRDRTRSQARAAATVTTAAISTLARSACPARAAKTTPVAIAPSVSARDATTWSITRQEPGLVRIRGAPSCRKRWTR